jgi:hypothetical protein
MTGVTFGSVIGRHVRIQLRSAPVLTPAGVEVRGRPVDAVGAEALAFATAPQANPEWKDEGA